VLEQYVHHYNTHRLHRTLAQAAPQGHFPSPRQTGPTASDGRTGSVDSSADEGIGAAERVGAARVRRPLQHPPSTPITRSAPARRPHSPALRHE
jgi:hypothetical protein